MRGVITRVSFESNCCLAAFFRWLSKPVFRERRCFVCPRIDRQLSGHAMEVRIDRDWGAKLPLRANLTFHSTSPANEALVLPLNRGRRGGRSPAASREPGRRVVGAAMVAASEKENHP